MDLGCGWKVHPFIKVKEGKTVVLADITGPGIINQFWITSDLPLYRALALRFYWDIGLLSFMPLQIVSVVERFYFEWRLISNPLWQQSV